MSDIDPEELAADLREELGIQGRSFNLLRLVREAGIRVVFAKSAEMLPGTEAFSFSSGDTDIIVIDTSSPSRMRLRYTLAHEFGHLLMGHSGSRCSSRFIHEPSRKGEERQADRFAAALLMSADLFRQDIAGQDLTLDAVKKLSDLYQVSLTAAALRFASLAEKGCAAACFRSSGATWITPGNRATPFTLLSQPGSGSLLDLRLKGMEAPPAADVPARSWIQGADSMAPYIHEEVVKTSSDSWLVLLSSLPEAASSRKEEPAPLRLLAESAAPSGKIAKNRSFAPLIAVLPRRGQGFGREDRTVSTSVQSLDWLLGGFRPGQLSVISGRQRSGKTSLALSAALQAAVREEKYVLALMIGHTRRDLEARLIASQSGISKEHVGRTGLAPLERAQLMISQSKLKILDGRTSAQGIRKANVLQREECGLIVIDDVQGLIGSDGVPWGLADPEGRDSILRDLKHLARELDTPVVLVCPVIPAIEDRPEKRLRLCDLEGTSALEADAEAVIFLQSEGAYGSGRQLVALQVAKNRSGNTGEIKVALNGSNFRFSELSGGTLPSVSTGFQS